MKKIIVLFTLMALVSGCVSQPPKNIQVPTNITPIKGDTAIIEIKDFAFSPGSITIKQGTSVTWINSDGAPHTVTSNTGEFDSVIQSGSRYTYRFDKTGVYEYSCTFHPNMIHGKITVVS